MITKAVNGYSIMNYKINESIMLLKIKTNLGNNSDLTKNKTVTLPHRRQTKYNFSLHV